MTCKKVHDVLVIVLLLVLLLTTRTTLGRDILGLEEELRNAKYVIVGAGLWGSTIAERITTLLNEPVILIDKRDHIGGNCWSQIDPETGIEFHRYGAHLFHTSLEHVWIYIKKFTEFTKYQHHVMTQYQGKVYPFPVNLKTINDFYGLNLKPWEVDTFLKSESLQSGVTNHSNLEDKAIQMIGRPLYEAFVKGYTQKQWQTDLRLLPADIIQRLPIRQNYKSSYFEDIYEGLPKDGYYNLFYNMTKNPLIRVMLNTNWFDVRDIVSKQTQVFYSGPIDQFFDYKFGRLGYRTLDFKCESHNVQDYQGIATMNYADLEVPYTRIHEWKHIHPERKDILQRNVTFICYEYSKAAGEDGEEYYPINTKQNQEVLKKYLLLAKKSENLVIAGRLGAYRYFDMDKVLDNALSCFQTFVEKLSCQTETCKNSSTS